MGCFIELNGQFFEKIESFDAKIRVVSLPKYQEMVTDGRKAEPTNGHFWRALRLDLKAMAWAIVMLETKAKAVVEKNAISQLICVHFVDPKSSGNERLTKRPQSGPIEIYRT